VVDFGLQILAASESLQANYELACEHEHSLCILIAHKKFRRGPEKRWHTHIDYAEFHRLVRSGEWRDKTSVDYALETPSWAVYGAAEAGFDPADKRVFRAKEKAARKEAAAAEAGGGGGAAGVGAPAEPNAEPKAGSAEAAPKAGEIASPRGRSPAGAGG